MASKSPPGATSLAIGGGHARGGCHGLQAQRIPQRLPESNRHVDRHAVLAIILQLVIVGPRADEQFLLAGQAHETLLRFQGRGCIERLQAVEAIALEFTEKHRQRLLVQRQECGMREEDPASRTMGPSHEIFNGVGLFVAAG